MKTVILFIWVAVSSGSIPKSDWRYAGEFHSPEACHAAGQNLNVHHRCLNKETGGVR